MRAAAMEGDSVPLRHSANASIRHRWTHRAALEEVRIELDLGSRKVVMMTRMSEEGRREVGQAGERWMLMLLLK
jgi:hypothetical protein